MATMNVHEAKTHLSRLLRRVEAGEEIVIARDGRPVARLVPLEAPAARRRLGAFRDRLSWSDDFEAPLPSDILEDFEGRE